MTTPQPGPLAPSRLESLSLITPDAADVPDAGFNGWAGFAWPHNSWAAADLKVPHLGPPNGSVAFWAGLGVGRPGIQQCGIACTYHNGVSSYQAWYEMWPAGAVPFGYHINPGDDMRFVVDRTNNTYRLTVINYTRGWTANHFADSDVRSEQAEAIAEAFGPEPCGFTAANFTSCSGVLGWEYSWPFGGEYAVRDSNYSFTIHRT